MRRWFNRGYLRSVDCYRIDYSSESFMHVCRHVSTGYGRICRGLSSSYSSAWAAWQCSCAFKNARLIPRAHLEVGEVNHACLTCNVCYIVQMYDALVERCSSHSVASNPYKRATLQQGLQEHDDGLAAVKPTARLATQQLLCRVYALASRRINTIWLRAATACSHRQYIRRDRLRALQPLFSLLACRAYKGQ